MTRQTGAEPAGLQAPYRVGEWVRGWTLPDSGGHEQPEECEGEVVQVGSGWDGVDAHIAYLWVRMASGREQRLAVRGSARTDRPEP
ncbi:hypothetical protein ACWGHM_31970 [Streptomyces sp. NPDC054904]|uniref:hypothetical protein n=1 Tax=unclassified Streptomyces TaxID=2593676 RepID=UPI00248207DD|nr:hypothetical protein [Streptomyces sp. Isolate_45]MDA5279890.1 hypothetical protein [Streptomyces sp. Isolate_45]